MAFHGIKFLFFQVYMHGNQRSFMGRDFMFLGMDCIRPIIGRLHVGMWSSKAAREVACSSRDGVHCKELRF